MIPRTEWTEFEWLCIAPIEREKGFSERVFRARYELHEWLLFGNTSALWLNDVSRSMLGCFAAKHSTYTTYWMKRFNNKLDNIET